MLVQHGTVARNIAQNCGRHVQLDVQEKKCAYTSPQVLTAYAKT